MVEVTPGPARILRGRWFVGDGLHLSSQGALGLARFLRPLVLASTCGTACQRAKRADD